MNFNDHSVYFVAIYFLIVLGFASLLFLLAKVPSERLKELRMGRGRSGQKWSGK
jgi:hypothetical protein